MNEQKWEIKINEISFETYSTEKKTGDSEFFRNKIVI